MGAAHAAAARAQRAADLAALSAGRALVARLGSDDAAIPGPAASGAPCTRCRRGARGRAGGRVESGSLGLLRFGLAARGSVVVSSCRYRRPARPRRVPVPGRGCGGGRPRPRAGHHRGGRRVLGPPGPAGRQAHVPGRGRRLRPHGRRRPRGRHRPGGRQRLPVRRGAGGPVRPASGPAVGGPAGAQPPPGRHRARPRDGRGRRGVACGQRRTVRVPAAVLVGALALRVPAGLRGRRGRRGGHPAGGPGNRITAGMGARALSRWW